MEISKSIFNTVLICGVVWLLMSIVGFVVVYHMTLFAALIFSVLSAIGVCNTVLILLWYIDSKIGA